MIWPDYCSWLIIRTLGPDRAGEVGNSITGKTGEPGQEDTNGDLAVLGHVLRSDNYVTCIHDFSLSGAKVRIL